MRILSVFNFDRKKDVFVLTPKWTKADENVYCVFDSQMVVLSRELVCQIFLKNFLSALQKEPPSKILPIIKKLQKLPNSDLDRDWLMRS